MSHLCPEPMVLGFQSDRDKVRTWCTLKAKWPENSCLPSSTSHTCLLKGPYSIVTEHREDKLFFWSKTSNAFWVNVCVSAKSFQLCPTLCDPMDCSLPGSSVHGILQARILEWVAMPSSRGSSWPRIEPESLVSPAVQSGSLPLAPPGRPVWVHKGWLFKIICKTLEMMHADGSHLAINAGRGLLLPCLPSGWDHLTDLIQS